MTNNMKLAITVCEKGRNCFQNEHLCLTPKVEKVVTTTTTTTTNAPSTTTKKTTPKANVTPKAAPKQGMTDFCDIYYQKWINSFHIWE